MSIDTHTVEHATANMPPQHTGYLNARTLACAFAVFAAALTFFLAWSNSDTQWQTHWTDTSTSQRLYEPTVVVAAAANATGPGGYVILRVTNASIERGPIYCEAWSGHTNPGYQSLTGLPRSSDVVYTTGWPAQPGFPVGIDHEQQIPTVKYLDSADVRLNLKPLKAGISAPFSPDVVSAVCFLERDPGNG